MSSTTMKAVVINQYGEPDELTYTEVPRPKVTDDTILVRVHAAGINPVDWKTRRGRGMAKRYGDNPFPLIIGWDISGVVEAVGANIRDFQVSDEVYGMVGFPDVGGAYAEYVLTTPQYISHKPKNLSHTEASVIPLAALTAWQAMFDTANLQPEQKILIHAAAGGVGHIAVQLARWKGAYVYGTASARNTDFLQSIGVNEHIDYQTANFEEVLSDVDVVFDLIGGVVAQKSAQTLTQGGFLVSIQKTGTDFETLPDHIQWQWILVEPNPHTLKQITEIVEAGQLKPAISHTFSLKELPDAHRQSESGRTRGKIAIQIVS